MNLDHVQTVDKARLRTFVGMLERVKMSEVCRALAAGCVIRAGRTLTVCSAEVHAGEAEARTSVAIMQAAMMTIRDRAGLRD